MWLFKRKNNNILSRLTYRAIGEKGVYEICGKFTPVRISLIQNTAPALWKLNCVREIGSIAKDTPLNTPKPILLGTVFKPKRPEWPSAGAGHPVLMMADQEIHGRRHTMRITLKAARVNKGFTQKEVAAQIGVAKETVGNWESGKTMPKADLIVALCNLYGLSYDSIKWKL